MEEQEQPMTQNSRPLPVLRREVVVQRERPGRAGMLLAACMFAGIFAGFSVKTMVLAQHSQQAVATSAHVAQESYPWLGVAVVTRGGSAVISAVYPNTPAHAAGLQRGMVIRSVDTRAVRSSVQVVNAIRAHRPGNLIELGVQRRDERAKVTVKLSSITKRQLRSLSHRR